MNIPEDNHFEYQNESKRRKAEEIERSFICPYKNCGKSYGSYPALYTHIKFKHSTNKHKSNYEKQQQKTCIRKNEVVNQTIASSSSQPQKSNEQKNIKFDNRTLNQLYSDLLVNLQAITQLYEQNSKTLQVSPTLCSLESLSEEFPSIQQLNQDILFPLKTELLSLTSPQTFARNSAQVMGIEHKLAEVLAFLGMKIHQELYSEFCYFLGFFGKCVALKKITNMKTAEEDFEQIYQYIHDSIGYCTTFRFKYLKNGKILENKNELTQMMKEILKIIILVTLKENKSKESGLPKITHFIL